MKIKIPGGLHLFRIIFVIIFLFSSMVAKSQSIDEVTISATFRNQPLKDFLEYLRNEHQLRVYYQDGWVRPYTIDLRFQDKPLIQVLNQVFAGHDLAYKIFQDRIIFVFPKKPDSRVQYFDETQVYTIGNPINSGRYKSATVSGRVFDGKNSEPLTGAVIFCPRLNRGVTTGKDGSYSFELPTGEHLLNFSFMGYQQSSLKIRLIEDGRLDFDLFEESHAIGEVVVKGEVADLPKSQMSIVQMSAKEIKQLPALMGEVDVLKGLSMLAGVQTVGELSSGFNVRGGNTDQNLILVSGSPVFNSSHLFGFLSLINPDMVDDVRLFKGGMPARYGERVASVMEVDFKDGNSETLGFYGGLGLINSRLTLDGPLSKNKKLTFIVGGRSSYTNWILRNLPEADLSQSRTNFYDLSGKLTWKFDLFNYASLTLYSSNDEFNTSTTSIMKYGNMLGNFRLNSRLSEKLYSTFEISQSRYSFRLTDFANGNPLESYCLDNALNYLSGSYQVKYHPHPRHLIESGMKGICHAIEPGKITPVERTSLILPRKLDVERGLEFAGFVSDEFEVNEAFSLIYGLRYSLFSNYGSRIVYLYGEGKTKNPENVVDSLVFNKNEITKTYQGAEPRFSLNYDLSSRSSVKLSYQRTRQYLYQLSNNAVISPAETWKASDYHLKPLISDQFALSLEKTSRRTGGVITAEIYYKALRNLIEYKNGAKLLMNEHIETSLIPSRGYSWGIELNSKKTTGRLTYNINYVYSRTMRKSLSLYQGENFWKGEFYPSIYDKPHDLSVNTVYNISRRWRIAGNFVFISGRPVTLPEMKYIFNGETLIYYSERNKYRMPPYHRADFSITFDENLRKKRMWKGSWTLSVYNLYGRHNPYSVYYRKSDPGIENDYRRYSLYKLSVIGVPVPSLTYNFKF